MAPERHHGRAGKRRERHLLDGLPAVRPGHRAAALLGRHGVPSRERPPERAHPDGPGHDPAFAAEVDGRSSRRAWPRRPGDRDRFGRRTGATDCKRLAEQTDLSRPVGPQTCRCRPCRPAGPPTEARDGRDHGALADGRRRTLRTPWTGRPGRPGAARSGPRFPWRLAAVIGRSVAVIAATSIGWWGLDRRATDPSEAGDRTDRPPHRSLIRTRTSESESESRATAPRRPTRVKATGDARTATGSRSPVRGGPRVHGQLSRQRGRRTWRATGVYVRQRTAPGRYHALRASFRGGVPYTSGGEGRSALVLRVGRSQAKSRELSRAHGPSAQREVCDSAGPRRIELNANTTSCVYVAERRDDSVPVVGHRARRFRCGRDAGLRCPAQPRRLPGQQPGHHRPQRPLLPRSQDRRQRTTPRWLPGTHGGDRRSRSRLAGRRGSSRSTPWTDRGDRVVVRCWTRRDGSRCAG